MNDTFTFISCDKKKRHMTLLKAIKTECIAFFTILCVGFFNPLFIKTFTNPYLQ